MMNIRNDVTTYWNETDVRMDSVTAGLISTKECPSYINLQKE